MEHKIAFEDLSPEIQEKLRNCKTKEELRELVTSLGAELSEEVLRAVSGGICTNHSAGKICVDCWVHSVRCPIKGVGDCPELFTCSTWSCEEYSGPSSPSECPELIYIIEKKE